MTRTPSNPSASTTAVLFQLHDRDFLSSSFAKERLSNSFAFNSIVRNQASVGESKKKKKDKKRRRLISRGGGGGSFATFELCCVRPCGSRGTGSANVAPNTIILHYRPRAIFKPNLRCRKSDHLKRNSCEIISKEWLHFFRVHQGSTFAPFFFFQSRRHLL